MKVLIDSLSEIPEALRSEYEQRDGKFYLKLEGDPPGFVRAADYADAKGKLVGFRDRNMALLKTAAELAGVSEIADDLAPLKEKLSRFDGVDPREYRELKARAEELRKKGVKDPDDIQEQIKAAIDSAIAPVREELESEKKARAEAQSRADEALLRQTIGDRYIKVGGKPNALDFIVTKSKEVFSVIDNEVKALDTKFSTANPGKPLEVDEWLTQATKEYDFAFEPSKGGGADPKPGTTKPGVKQLVDPTPQELGRHSKEIAEGKLQVIHSQQQ